MELIEDVVIVSAARTPIGKLMGALFYHNRPLSLVLLQLKDDSRIKYQTASKDRRKRSR